MSRLASLYNISIYTGQRPADWKLLNVVPIPKEPNKSDVRFFRPISRSLFPIVSKVLERHLHQLLMDQLLVSRNVLSYIQFGFRKDRASSSLCSSLHTIGIFHLKSTIKWPVFFDFAKAFESAPHQALLNELHQLIIPPVLFQWLSNYLSDRFQ